MQSVRNNIASYCNKL